MKGTCALINTNDIIKMQIEVTSKPLIWLTPHYYLCWKNDENKKSFFIFTSNFFKLFANNTCSIYDFSTIEVDKSLPFTKRTYLVHNESFNIDNMIEPEKFFDFSGTPLPGP